MEEWERHFHLESGRCFQMYFSEYGRVISFRVKGSDSSGNKIAIDMETNEEFRFNRNQLLKKDYSTFVEIDCI